MNKIKDTFNDIHVSEEKYNETLAILKGKSNTIINRDKLIKYNIAKQIGLGALLVVLTIYSIKVLLPSFKGNNELIHNVSELDFKSIDILAIETIIRTPIVILLLGGLLQIITSELNRYILKFKGYYYASKKFNLTFSVLFLILLVFLFINGYDKKALLMLIAMFIPSGILSPNVVKVFKEKIQIKNMLTQKTKEYPLENFRYQDDTSLIGKELVYTDGTLGAFSLSGEAKFLMKNHLNNLEKIKDLDQKEYINFMLGLFKKKENSFKNFSNKLSLLFIFGYLFLFLFLITSFARYNLTQGAINIVPDNMVINKITYNDYSKDIKNTTDLSKDKYNELVSFLNSMPIYDEMYYGDDTIIKELDLEFLGNKKIKYVFTKSYLLIYVPNELSKYPQHNSIRYIKDSYKKNGIYSESYFRIPYYKDVLDKLDGILNSK